jgi:CheY-like chemotaxis protein
MAKQNITQEGATEGGPVVLVATAVPADRAFFSELLAHAGYEVVLAVDGQDAFRKVVLCWPVLIVLDLDLPLLSGREFLRIRSEYERLTLIPVIVIADDSPHPEVDAVVARPFVPEQVLAEVRRLTGFLKQTA